MKKIKLYFGILLIMLALFSGCSTENNDSEDIGDDTVSDNIDNDVLDNHTLNNSLEEEFISDDVEIGELI